MFLAESRKQKAESRKQKNEVVIDVSHLAAGVYFVEIEIEGGEKAVHKMVKK